MIWGRLRERVLDGQDNDYTQCSTWSTGDTFVIKTAIFTHRTAIFAMQLLYCLILYTIAVRCAMKFIDNYANRISDNSEESEIISYGLEQLFVLVIGLSIAIIIGFILRIPLQTIVFILLLFPLRQNAGGFHARGRLTCSILSAAIFLGSLIIIRTSALPSFVNIIMYVIGSAMLVPFAPVGNKNKPLDDLEKKVYGKRTIIIWVTESLLFVILESQGISSWSTIVALSILLCGALVTSGYIQEIRDEDES